MQCVIEGLKVTLDLSRECILDGKLRGLANIFLLFGSSDDGGDGDIYAKEIIFSNRLLILKTIVCTNCIEVLMLQCDLSYHS